MDEKEIQEILECIKDALLELPHLPVKHHWIMEEPYRIRMSKFTEKSVVIEITIEERR